MKLFASATASFLVLMVIFVRTDIQASRQIADLPQDLEPFRYVTITGA